MKVKLHFVYLQNVAYSRLNFPKKNSNTRSDHAPIAYCMTQHQQQMSAMVDSNFHIKTAAPVRLNLHFNLFECRSRMLPAERCRTNATPFAKLLIEVKN